MSAIERFHCSHKKNYDCGINRYGNEKLFHLFQSTNYSRLVANALKDYKCPPPSQLLNVRWCVWRIQESCSPTMIKVMHANAPGRTFAWENLSMRNGTSTRSTRVLLSTKEHADKKRNKATLIARFHSTWSLYQLCKCLLWMTASSNTEL